MGAINKGHGTLITGWQRLGDAATAVTIDTGASNVRIKAVTIVAMDDNSSQIIIGHSDIVASSQVRGFDAGKGITYEPTNTGPVNLSSFFINGGASSDGVDIFAIKA